MEAYRPSLNESEWHIAWTRFITQRLTILNSSLRIGEDLARRRKPQEALPYLLKAMEDPNNLDAVIQVAFLMPTISAGVKLLEEAEARGKYASLVQLLSNLTLIPGRADLLRRLGPNCFDDDGDHVGHFWGILETRPYMRILQAIVRLTFENKDYGKSA